MRRKKMLHCVMYLEQVVDPLTGHYQPLNWYMDSCIDDDGNDCLKECFPGAWEIKQKRIEKLGGHYETTK